MTANAPPVAPLETELQQAIAEHQAGRYVEAEELYLSILQVQPYHAIANHNLGLLAGQVGQYEAGLPYLLKALSVEPDEGQFWLSYANGLLQAGQAAEALDIIDTAIGRGLDNESSQLLRQRVLQAIAEAALSPSQEDKEHIVKLYHSGDFAQMESACRDLLEKFPESSFGWSVLGTALQVQGKDALAALHKTVELTPYDAQAHGNLGNALQDIGNMDAAIDSYLRALEIDPEFAEAHSNLGSALQSQGRHQEASASYQRALAIRPDYAKAHFNLGNTLKTQGKLEQAANSYRSALEFMPHDTEAHFQLGEISHALGHFDEAASSFRAQLQITPLDARAHAGLGAALQGTGQLENAVASYRRAAELDPAIDMLYHNMALALHSLEQYDAAVDAYRQALATAADCAPLHARLAEAYRALGQTEAAVACYREAATLHPDDINIHINLGVCLNNLGHAGQAIDSYRRALHIDGNSIITLNNLGVALLDLHQFEEAITLQQHAIRISPDSEIAYCNLGACLQALGKFEEAEASYRQALALRPDYIIAHNNLCTTLQHLGRHEEALQVCLRVQELGLDTAEFHFNIANSLQALRQTDAAKTHYLMALERNPDFAEAHVNLGALLQQQGQGEQGMAHIRQALQAKHGHYTMAHSNLLFSLSHSDTADADMLFAEHCRYGALIEASLDGTAASQPFPNTQEPERRLRIGLVSGDFNNHALASFLAPVLTVLAGNPNLALYAYYNKIMEDADTEKLRACMDEWRNVTALSDDALEKLIRTDAIDILIDLSGHSAANRLPVFARKPAPVQVSWMGYPGTTGLRAMDYFLSDNKILPAGQFDHQFLEKIVHLPISAPFTPYGGSAGISPLPALANGYVTFGSFNRANKLNRKVIALWAQVLRALPNSVMLLAGLNGDERDDYLRAWFAEEGIDNTRLRFHARGNMDEYMQLHHQVDVCLNTFPYTGTTTLCHALWMGVPTLSLSGSTIPTRAAAAYLGHLGLEAFAADDEENFVNKGIFLSQNISALAHLRATLRERLLQAPITKPALVTQGLERSLRIMWRRWCAQLPPISFDAMHHDQQPGTAKESTP
ncbi:MAG: hypothetical protein RLZZ237_1317 [Pseudomonadota bacterium]|jgi:predicted O-linked N-acetylglucosamine transferase (SPINDLY family)